MPVEITPIFLVLAAVIGLLIGMLVASLFSSKDSKHTEKNEPPEFLARDGFSEVAHLWYSPGGKKVITELDGEHYRDYLTLSADQKARVNKMITQWSDWAGRAPESDQVTNYEKIRSSLADTPTQEEENLPPLGPVLDWSVAEALRSEKPVETILEAAPVKPKTIAGQISLILEKMLEGNPLKEKGIKLIENSKHGVDVWIGLEKFDGIDAIPYPEVQELIRQAAAQWEREMVASRNQI